MHESHTKKELFLLIVLNSLSFTLVQSRWKYLLQLKQFNTSDDAEKIELQEAQMLLHLSAILDQLKSNVKIPCECVSKYIGETGRPLDIESVSTEGISWNWIEKVREEADEAATSIISSHAVEHNHQVNWEEVTILANKSNTRKIKIHEAAAMHIEDNVIN
jgi:hypothetical protein